MMLAPEITLFASAVALLVTLVNSLLVIATRRGMSKQLAELRLEVDANLSASHSLARHVREIQKRGVQGRAPGANNVGLSESSDREDFDGHLSKQLDKRFDERPDERFDEQKATDSLSLAEKLGLSQSEAEIISHLRPRHNQKIRGSTDRRPANRLRESA